MRKYFIPGVVAVVVLATGCAEMSDTQPVSYTHLTLPTNREV